jgi:hypothetical protein
MWQNQIIGEVVPETKVFRFFPISRLESVLETKQITLARPRKWDDPCENQLYNIKVIDWLTQLPVSVESLRACLYGQSWTLTEESDALWRIYSDDKRGVRVATTVGKLMKALWDGCGATEELKPFKCFLGKVSYYTEEMFQKYFEDPRDCLSRILDGSGRQPVDFLLMKREAFGHEKEMRLIYQETESGIDRGNYLPLAVDPSDLFDELCLDPRLPQECFEIMQKSLGRRFQGVIRKSDLYRVPMPPTCIIGKPISPGL